jgi:hypothetical protein
VPQSRGALHFHGFILIRSLPPGNTLLKEIPASFKGWDFFLVCIAIAVAPPLQGIRKEHFRDA